MHAHIRGWGLNLQGSTRTMKMYRIIFASALFASLLPFGSTDVIPESFVYGNVSQYTVRYLSVSGRDTASCLANQDYPPAVTSKIEYCRTLQFALTGSYNFFSENISRVIVLARSGSYSFGVTGIKIYHSNHIILSKIPGEEGEVLLSCDDLAATSYNNLYYYNSSYLSVNGVVLSRCGQYSTALVTISARRLVISNTTFR